MMRNLTVAGVCAVLCTATALAQSSAQPATTTSSSGPSAWVYVTGQVGNNPPQVYGFTAGPGGKLTPMPASPFPAHMGGLAANGKYLFGIDQNGMNVDAYKIESTGQIYYSAATNADKYQCNMGVWGPLVLDHWGASVYTTYFDNSCGNYAMAAWNVVKSNGGLTFLDTAGSDDGLIYPLTFTANNQYAFTAGCYRLGPAIYSFRRNSNGSLTEFNLNNYPVPKAQSGQDYCMWGASADPTNHLAVPVVPYSGYNGPLGPWQIAVYTVNSNGSLTTQSTYSNMPKVKVGEVNEVRMSPSGKLLAVAGSAGLQVFHFNGGAQVTHYTGLMSSIGMTSVRWDNNNHLYATSSTSNRLVVFTVTPMSWKWVATYSVPQAGSIAVQPLPLPWN